MQQKNENQEIDLLELFNQLGKGIKKLFIGIFKSIWFLILFAIKNIHFLAIFAIVGALAGFLLYSSTLRYYSSNLVAQPNGITSADMVNYINDLHELCINKNTAALSFSLKMEDSLAKKIKNIQAYYVIDINGDEIGDYVDFENNVNLKDTTQKRLDDRIYVSVEVFDNRIFEFVKQGLLSYMRKSQYFIKLNEIRKNELQELIAQTDYEIAKLDSLQNFEYFQKDPQLSLGESQLMFLSEKDQHLYYRDKLNLLLKKQEYQKELELTNDAFTVIKDFTNLVVAENPRGTYLTKFGIIFLIVGYIILILYKYQKKISWTY